MSCKHLGSIDYDGDNIWDELVGYITRTITEEPEVVVVATDLAQCNERLGQDCLAT